MKKYKVYMGIPSTGNRSDAQVYQLRAIEKKYKDTVELVYPEACVHRIFHDFARNATVDDFLASDCDILWFLDSDIVPHGDVLDMLVKHGEHWEAAGAPYPVFMVPQGYDDPQVVWTVYNDDGVGLSAENVPTEGTAFVSGIATGCMFLKREIFQKLSKPYFEFKYREDDRRVIEGEDLGFCRKVNAIGYQFFIDYAMVCRHYKSVDLLDVNNYARVYARTSIQQYDARIQPQVRELAVKYKRLLESTQPKSSLILPK